MATIGTFHHDSESGEFIGRIQTLTVNAPVSFLPALPGKDGDKAPTFRLYSGTVDIGAAWEKTSERSGKKYLSVKLDDPSFAAPIFATLLAGEDDEYALIWSRSHH